MEANNGSGEVLTTSTAESWWCGTRTNEQIK